MATTNIYFSRDGAISLDLGTVNSIQYANVTLSINGIEIHNSGPLAKGQKQYDWAVSDSERALIISQLPANSKNVQGKMKVDVTWEPWGWDAPLYSHEYTVSFIIEESEKTKPSITLVSKVSSAYNKFVQGKTKLIYTVRVEAKNGATLKEPTASVNGVACTFVETDTNGNYVFQSEWLITSGTNSVSVTAKDSRGFSRTLTDEIYVHPYTPPTLSSLASELGVVCRRWRPDTGAIDDINGTQCRVAVGIYVSYIPNLQTGYVVTYRYREEGSANWSEFLPVGDSNEVIITESGLTEYRAIITDGTTIGENGVVVGKFNSLLEYEIEIMVTDNLGEFAIRYEQIRGKGTSFNIHDEGDAVSVGKYATRHKCFDSAWDIHSDEDVEAEKDIYVGKTLYLEGVAVVASAEELNHCDGVTDNIQKQLDSKAEEDHLHPAREIYYGESGFTYLDTWMSSTNSDLTTIKSQISSLISEVEKLKKS